MPVTSGTSTLPSADSGRYPEYLSTSSITCFTNGAATVLPNIVPTCGSSTNIRQTYFGSSAGAKPMNDAISCPCATLPSEPYFCAVPVFPPTLYPGMAAFLPLPSLTTLSAISRTRAEVSSLITRRTTVGSFFSTTVPSGATMLSTTYGCIRLPPFTAALTAVTSCSGVTAMLCPKPMRAKVLSVMYFWCVTMPALSPVIPLPVEEPKPKEYM